jgi:hypothetical protein
VFEASGKVNLNVYDDRIKSHLEWLKKKVTFEEGIVDAK